VNKRPASTNDTRIPITFVVERPLNAAILRSVLNKNELENSRFFGAQGYISLASLARNILVKEGVPVLVIADSDAVPPEQVRDENIDAIESLAPVAPFGVAVFSPSLTAVVTEATGRSVHEPPVGTDLFDPIAVAALRKHPQVQSFLNNLARLKSKCASIYELEADAGE
jgi:hypothetical protein